YFEEVNLNGGPQAYQLQQVVTTTGGLYASGYNVAEPPTFFMPSTATGAEWYNVKAVEIDATVDGEGWALATPDDGASWYVGGRDQGAGAAATGFLYESTDGGATWTSLTLGDEIDIIRDIDFADDGMHGIAVGDRYPPNSLGGFALITEDGGSTWTELDEDLPEDLQRCEAEGSDWFIGGNGYLFRGSF
ncbi:MAG: WD40/YVTN/BNR-like repeat-containing protein, partial [Myxococcota bacterium]